MRAQVPCVHVTAGGVLAECACMRKEEGALQAEQNRPGWVLHGTAPKAPDADCASKSCMSRHAQDLGLCDILCRMLQQAPASPGLVLEAGCCDTECHRRA